MTIEADYTHAKLMADGAASEAEGKEGMRKADAAYNESRAEFDQFRAELPTDLRKLTAGCDTPLGFEPWLINTAAKSTRELRASFRCLRDRRAAHIRLRDF